MNKKDAAKLKPGTWVEVTWGSRLNTTALVLERHNPKHGDVRHTMYHLHAESIDTRITQREIVCVIGKLYVPDTAAERKIETRKQRPVEADVKKELK